MPKDCLFHLLYLIRDLEYPLVHLKCETSLLLRAEDKESQFLSPKVDKSWFSFCPNHGMENTHFSPHSHTSDLRNRICYKCWPFLKELTAWLQQHYPVKCLPFRGNSIAIPDESVFKVAIKCTGMNSSCHY